MTRTSAAPMVTLVDLGIDRLHVLCDAFGYGTAQTRLAEAVFRALSASWGGEAIQAPPRWPSDITDDHTPFEFSLAVEGAAPELRFLTEVRGPEPSLSSHWEAARAANRRLAADFGVPLERFSAVEDIFVPTDEARRFAMWHAVCFPLGAAPTFKVYLNPQARGWAHARRLIDSALFRLGLGEASVHLPPPTPHDEHCYFSLDLSAHRGARIKVYTAHYNATAQQIEAAVSTAHGYTPGQAAAFCAAMSECQGPFHDRPVLTCLSFAEGSARPTTATVHFPVRAYARDDGIVRERVLRYLDAEAGAVYDRAIEAFADRHLDDGVGMQTYISLRLERERRRVTVYLAPEVYDVGQAPMTEPKCSGVIERLRRRRSWLAAAGGEND